MRTLIYIVLVFSALIIFGCADENTNATFGAHPANFVLGHGDAANTDLDSCQLCHGIDFNGSGNVISCFTCHADGPPFISHPASWVDIRQDHQTFFTTESWTQCANAACHGIDMQGGDFGPSCFSADFDGLSCHIQGPVSPHGTPFLARSLHGPVAKGAQLECRNCHGRPLNIFDGGYVVEILGLNDSPGGNCSSCHPEARAHPVYWQGTNDQGVVYVSSHQGEFNASCALCHKTDGPGDGPLPPAPSCFVAEYDNSNSGSGLLPCHAGGPGVPHVTGADWLLPSAHVADWQANSPPCFDCHNVSSGGIDPTCQSCHTQVDPTVVSSGCRSCHDDTAQLLESSGRHDDHDGIACSECHFGFGSNSLNHWYPNPNPPSEIQLAPSITMSSFNTSNCTGTCHGETHSNENW